MEHQQQEGAADICPWCDSELVWDEEIGPEEVCPHCSNELGGYRTLSVGGAQAEEEDEGAGLAAGHAGAAARTAGAASRSVEGLDEEADWEAGDDTGWAGAGRPQSWLRADEKVQRILDDQEEMPECPSCREYMLHAGTNTLGAGSFSPVEPPSLKKPLLPDSIRLQLYVCPNCHEVSTKLDLGSRTFLAERLDQED
ncbi:hypothetical protein ACTHPH_22755 [Paenibacillus pasadenensis]|uniref:Uncharacterized protein n=1 Tax=Paenibacillus pasadenensis TaxID=217090 RepID=A0A2N5N479_9BACL|nr:hypothetical protein [Paenibacillus pasadenensis]PLT45089.1 hypothetical protein B8V81_3520 [Paenibacillus pasadenensis]